MNLNTVARNLLIATLWSPGFVGAEEPKPEAGAVNHVLNGGFEDGLNGWEVFPASARAASDSQWAHGGTKSLKLTNLKGVSSRMWQTIRLEEDGPVEIKFSCWMRRAGTDPYAQVGIDFVVHAQDGSVKAYWWAIPGGTKEWACNSTKTFTVNESAESVEVYLLIYCADAIYPPGKKAAATSETAWFDDVVVTVAKKRAPPETQGK